MSASKPYGSNLDDKTVEAVEEVLNVVVDALLKEFGGRVISIAHDSIKDNNLNSGVNAKADAGRMIGNIFLSKRG